VCFESLSSIKFFLYLLKFPRAYAREVMLHTMSFLHAITNHVSCQYSPLHTRAKKHVPTTPRRQIVADDNADFAEVSSPCPKVILFPFQCIFAVFSSSKGF
jgi:hypothetical protein